MDDRIGRLEKEICDLASRLEDCERRLGTLEAAGSPAQPQSATSPNAEFEAFPPTAGTAVLRDASGTLALAGRLFIVIGGAYLLRALTEGSTLPAGTGITLGLAYALFWIFAAGRAAAKKQMPSGICHGLAGCLIAFPLIWESATRFRILDSPLDIIFIAALTAVCLFIACRHRFQTLAWLSVGGAVITTLVLLPESHSLVPPTVFLIVLGGVTLWLGYELEWKGLRWLVAAAANLAVLGLTYSALASHPRESPGAALLVQLLMLGMYLTIIAIRTLVRARNVIPFEVFQVIAAFLLGFVGAVYTTRATGTGSGILGVSALVLGASCYAVAFAFMDKRAGRDRNFHFYTSLALLFTLTGTRLLLNGTSLSFAWIIVAVMMSWLGWTHARFSLTVHATVAVIAAVFYNHIPAFAAAAFIGTMPVGLMPSPSQGIVLAGAAICLWWPLPPSTDTGQVWVRIQRFLLTLVLVSGIGGSLISITAFFLAQPHGKPDAGVLATIRTIVLSISALVLAWMGRHRKFEEWGWLLYPVLAATGFKMLFEDFPSSRPGTLFLALAAYGAVLILSPRLRRKPDAP